MTRARTVIRKLIGAALAAALGAGAAEASTVGSCRRGYERETVRECTALIEHGTLLPAPLLALAYAIRASALDAKSALDDFTRAIALDPLNSIFHEERAVRYEQVHRRDNALADHERAIELRAAGFDASMESGRAGLRIGPHWSEYYAGIAALHFSRAIKLKPRASQPYIYRGYAYLWSDRPSALLNERALVDFDRAIALDPRHYEAYQGRSFAYFRLGDNDRALADCDKLVALLPDDAEPFYLRSKVFAAKGVYDRALRDANAAIDRYLASPPDDRWLSDPRARAKHGGFRKADFVANRGRVYEQKGDRDRAIADYRLAPNRDESELGLKRLGVAP